MRSSECMCVQTFLKHKPYVPTIILQRFTFFNPWDLYCWRLKLFAGLSPYIIIITTVTRRSTINYILFYSPLALQNNCSVYLNFLYYNAETYFYGEWSPRPLNTCPYMNLNDTYNNNNKKTNLNFCLRYIIIKQVTCSNLC